MTIKIERKAWEPNFPHGKMAVSKWDATDIRQFVDFVTKAGLEVPRLVILRLHNGSTVGVAPERKKNEPRNAYRRRVRLWRKEHHGSISKMRAVKRAVQLKEQRWSVLREQGFPLKDPEALIWFIKANVWNPKSKLAVFGYLHHSVLLGAAGGTLPTAHPRGPGAARRPGAEQAACAGRANAGRAVPGSRRGEPAARLRGIEVPHQAQPRQHVHSGQRPLEDRGR